jgi:hypothetical protein
VLARTPRKTVPRIAASLSPAAPPTVRSTLSVFYSKVGLDGGFLFYGRVAAQRPFLTRFGAGRLQRSSPRTEYLRAAGREG